MIDLDALEALADAATPGPWGEDDGYIFCRPLADARHAAIIAKIDGQPFDESAIHLDSFVATTEQRHPESDADAAFIAASRDAVPALIRELRAARAVVEAARPSMHDGRDCGSVEETLAEIDREYAALRDAVARYDEVTR